jgi:hypothetical protein
VKYPVLGIFTHDEKIYLVFYPMAARSPFAVTRWMMFHDRSQPWVKKECNNCSFQCVKKQQKTGVLSGCAAVKGGANGIPKTSRQHLLRHQLCVVKVVRSGDGWKRWKTWSSSIGENIIPRSNLT